MLTPPKTWVCVMFAALNMDRGNISNAVSDNMLDDLGLTHVDYVSMPTHSTLERGHYVLRE